MKYAVKLEFIYSDIVHVEAENIEDAEKLALEECREEYDKYHDCTVNEEME